MSFIKSVNHAAKKERTNNKKPFHKRKGWKVFFLVLGTFLILIASLFAYVYKTGSKIFDNQFSQGSSLARAIKGENLDGEADGRVNILLMGRGGDNHPGGLLTDSMMVASINIKEKKMAIISVPRDLLVPIKDHGQDKLNSAFAYGYKDYLDKSCKKKKQADCNDDALASGSQLAKDTISNVLGIPIQYYVMMDFEGFKQIVDKIGGIDVYVDRAIYDPLYPDKTMQGYETFTIKAGEQHMNGETALKYSRSRETTSDFDRSRRQQQVIAAVKAQTLQAGVLANPKKVLDLITIIGDHLRTNFQPSEIKLLADLVKNLDQGNIISKVLSSGAGGYLMDDSSTGTYYLRPKTGNFSEIQNMVKNIFSNTTENQASLRVEILNASKTPGLASKVASELKDTQFEIIAVKNSNDKIKNTVIYDYSNGSNKTALDFLKNKYEAEVIKKTNSVNSSVDITIVIGDDFSVSSDKSEISKR
ncbi:MAG: LCP family protein [Patescibacteria group bacterium]|nr:LCP family protein [Patescibacteria group bacterium]